MPDEVDSNIRTQVLLTAWLCTRDEYFATMSITQKALWLMGMGLTRQEAALVLGSTDQSLRVMIGQAKASK